ncbi:MAG: zinc ABC transporter substrate-binding protein [Spirochaetaceae bacterium]|jgi:zinc transport system substrate-binding protein|nr:zinc ABC transporter substrate-binding protein [Spirochaetaceae bacterium]
MKRVYILAILLTGFCAFLFTGCAKKASRARTDGKINITATIFPPFDFARAIAGDKANLSMLLPPGAESHSFEPTPADIIKVQNSDVFIYIGGESEVWVDRILDSIDTSDMKIVRLLDCVDAVEEEIVEGMQEDEEGHEHGHEEFTINDVKDRALGDWAGDWQSVYPYLLDGTLNPVMEHKAEDGEKTSNEYFEQYKKGYATDVERIVIDNGSMTFFTKGKPAKSQYVYRGTAVATEDDGGLWVRYKFEATGNTGGAPKYVLFSDHLHAPQKAEHFHIYSGNESFEVFTEDKNPVNYPTYYPAALSKSEIVAEMLEHEEEAEFDEHIWTSPRNAMRMVSEIANALAEKDSANAAFYRQNAESYTAELASLDMEIRSVTGGAARNTLVFADRFPFRYFADEYGLEYFAAFPGCSTETEPSAATVAFLIKKIQAEKIPVVFHIELSNEKMADAVAEQTGAKKRLLNSAHNVSKKDFDSGVRYLDIMKANLEALRDALN